MNRIYFSKLKIGVLLFVLSLLTSCITVIMDPSQGSSVNETYRKTLRFSNQALDLNDLVCSYGSVDFEAFGRTQVKAVVEGSSAKPQQVIVTRTLGPQPASGPLPSVTVDGGWQARGNALNCSILGCPTGSYSVSLRYPKETTCPSSVILALEVL